MDFLYLTADRIGAPTGGGQVTGNEWQAMQELACLTHCDWPEGRGLRSAQCAQWSFPDAPRPWGSDEQAHARLVADPSIRPRLCHIYAGCFTETVKELQSRGCKVVYTVAAHDRHVSREEHEALGLPFPYPHLTDDEQFARYSGGYRNADVVVAPGEAPRKVLARDGVDPARIRVIPHGHNPPDHVAPMPEGFHVGYLGSAGADKGLRYLIEAWAILNYPDAVLHIAGPGTEHLWPLVRKFGRGSFNLRGYLKSPSMLYDSVNLYVQPSATEGFGIEVLEAMAHGRYALCSDGAGACKWANAFFKARDAADLATAIDYFRTHNNAPDRLWPAREGLSWPAVRERYKQLWREVLNGAA